jgi:hypothetical protein
MKRFIAAAFALIGLALTTGALAAPVDGSSAAREAENHVVVNVGEAGRGPQDVIFHPPICEDGQYHCWGNATVLICECDEDEEV